MLHLKHQSPAPKSTWGQLWRAKLPSNLPLGVADACSEFFFEAEVSLSLATSRYYSEDTPNKPAQYSFFLSQLPIPALLPHPRPLPVTDIPLELLCQKGGFPNYSK